MEHRALAALIVRIAGLLIVVTALANSAKSIAPFFYPKFWDKPGAGVMLLEVIVVVAIPVAIGLFLINFPALTTRKVLRIEGIDAETESQVQPLQRVAFAAIGLWLSIYAILDVLYVYARYRLLFALTDDLPSYANPPPVSAEDYASYITSGVQLLIGVLLLLGNRGLASVIARLRG